MDEADIKAFASQYDPQPFHLDAEAAKHSSLGRLVASGWHTAAITMRLLVEGGFPIAGGVMARAPHQVAAADPIPGQRTTVRGSIVEITPPTSEKRPDRGARKPDQRGDRQSERRGRAGDDGEPRHVPRRAINSLSPQLPYGERVEMRAATGSQRQRSAPHPLTLSP